MKLSDPTAETLVSHERQFLTEKECEKEAMKFRDAHSGIECYTIAHGYSFGIDSMEYRFIFTRKIIASSIDYYEIKKDATDELRKVYADYTSPSGGYTAITYPYEDGGVDQDGQRTARGIMANVKTGAPIGLIINPPFPNGHPIRLRSKLRAEKYLLLLIGLSVGLTVGPALKILTKFLGKKR